MSESALIPNTHPKPNSDRDIDMDLSEYGHTSLKICWDRAKGRAYFYNENSLMDKTATPLLSYDESVKLIIHLCEFYENIQPHEIDKLNQEYMQPIESPIDAPGYVYLMESAGYYKIGYTNVSPRVRLLQLRRGSPTEIKLIWSIKVANPQALERELHLLFEANRVHGEWFDLNESDVNRIKNLAEVSS